MVTLNARERKRVSILGKVDRGEITAAQGAEAMGLSLSHARRLLARYRQEGPGALAHGNRGRKPAPELRPSIITRA